MKFSKIDGALMPISTEDQAIFAEIGENVIFECEIVKAKSSRTLTQNAAIHVYFELLAEALNDAGKELKKMLMANEVDIPWCKDSVKALLWKPIQAAMEKGDSTTELSTVTVSEVYLVLSRHISSNYGVNVEFPSSRG